MSRTALPSRLTPQHVQQLDGIVRRLHATLAGLASPLPAGGKTNGALCAHLASQAAALDASWNAQAGATRAQARLATRMRQHLRALAAPEAAPPTRLEQELRRTEAELRHLLQAVSGQERD